MTITMEELEIYEKVRKTYYTDDAKAQVCRFVDSILDSIDYEAMAEEFMSEYDCNFSENEMWEALVPKYVKEQFENKDTGNWEIE